MADKDDPIYCVNCRKVFKLKDMWIKKKMFTKAGASTGDTPENRVVSTRQYVCTDCMENEIEVLRAMLVK